MTITASIERLTPLSYVHDDPKIQTESERGAYIVGFHRARAKALQIGAQYEEENDDLREALQRVANLNPDAGEIGEGMLRTIVSEARQALAKATGGEG